MAFKLIDMTGMSFGKLTVIKRSERRPNEDRSRVYWDCKCACGKRIRIRADKLRAGLKTSCGCGDPLTDNFDWNDWLDYTIEKYKDGDEDGFW